MTRPHLATAAALGAFTLLTFFQFPGHTWLQQDSQIYVAMLEHLDNPATLSRDLMCVHPHVKWTAFDEIARALHAISGLSYHAVFDLQLLVFRLLGLMGIFLLAGSAGVNRIGAIFVSCLFGLGMSVGGPEILTIEYEAVPRGFALMLLLAALGYGAYRRWKVSAAFAAVALLYHPPTSAPYWLAVLVYALVLQRPKALRTALAALTAWATVKSPPDALFHFADAGHSTAPGIFRAEAVRALYVDWKGGGQVNQNWTFAREWQNRWNRTREARAPLLPAGEYAAAGIDYIVVGAKNGLPGLKPVYSNAEWRVFELKPAGAR